MSFTERELAVRFDLMQSSCVWMKSTESRSVNPSTQLLPLIEIYVSLSVLVRLSRLKIHDYAKFGIIPS